MADKNVNEISLDGHRLIYATAGNADHPPVIMIHGWFSFHGVWRQTVEALRADYFCVTPDLLGFGDSDKPRDADYSIEAQGRRVLRLADALGFSRFALMGHSMGGQIALCIAAMLAPERVTQAVSVDGVVTGRLMPLVRFVYAQAALGYRFPWAYALARWLDHYRWFAYLEHRPWFYRMNSIPFEDWAIDRAMSTQSGIHVSVYKAGQAIRALNLTPHLHHITAPTLAIFGEYDGTVPVADGRLVEQHVPGGRLVLIKTCGHFPMYEQTQTYLDTLQAFLGTGFLGQ